MSIDRTGGSTFSDEEQMLLDLVDRFVDERLIPLERAVLARRLDDLDAG